MDRGNSCTGENERLVRAGHEGPLTPTAASTPVPNPDPGTSHHEHAESIAERALLDIVDEVTCRMRKAAARLAHWTACPSHVTPLSRTLVS